MVYQLFLNGMDKLTTESLQNVFEKLEQNNQYQPLVWIENIHWYLSETAKLVKFDCSEEELNNADETGFIKIAQGVKLYLSKFVPSKNKE